MHFHMESTLFDYIANYRNILYRTSAKFYFLREDISRIRILQSDNKTSHPVQ